MTMMPVGKWAHFLEAQFVVTVRIGHVCMLMDHPFDGAGKK